MVVRQLLVPALAEIVMSDHQVGEVVAQVVHGVESGF